MPHKLLANHLISVSIGPQRPSLTHHGRTGLQEPVEAELWRVTDALAQLVVDTLLVEAQFVQHADKETVLLLCVVLALVGAVGDAQLMEGSLVAANLSRDKQEFELEIGKKWCNEDTGHLGEMLKVASPWSPVLSLC